MWIVVAAFICSNRDSRFRHLGIKTIMIDMAMFMTVVNINFSSYPAFRTTDFASQKWISVMGPGLSPSRRSCSDSLDNTSSTFKDHKDHQHLVHLEEDCADPDRNDHDQHNYHCLYADPDNSGQYFMEGLSPS